MEKQILAFLETFLTAERKARFTGVLEERTRHFTVAIEDVYQQHNSSAVIRSCESFGIQDIHLINMRNETHLDKNIALGAEKWLSISKYNSTDSCIETLKNKGYSIVACTSNKNDCNLQDFDISKKSAFFFGTEKQGLTQKALDKADVFLKIPMVGFTESLNISVAAAIILQQLSFNLKKSKIKWGLLPEEKSDLQLQWTKKSIKNIDAILCRYQEEKLNK